MEVKQSGHETAGSVTLNIPNHPSLILQTGHKIYTLVLHL